MWKNSFALNELLKKDVKEWDNANLPNFMMWMILFLWQFYCKVFYFLYWIFCGKRFSQLWWSHVSFVFGFQWVNLKRKSLQSEQLLNLPAQWQSSWCCTKIDEQLYWMMFAFVIETGPWDAIFKYRRGIVQCPMVLLNCNILKITCWVAILCRLLLQFPLFKSNWKVRQMLEMASMFFLHCRKVSKGNER